MSRLAKKPIQVFGGVSVVFENGELKVRGPKGELSRKIPEAVYFDISENEVYVKSKNDSKDTRALLGTFVRHLSNMIKGVHDGFEKKLQLEGVGFKADIKDGALVLSLGFSHKITIKPPDGIAFLVEKNIITVSGTDKESVGNTASMIRSYKKPEPYKGKGIRYVGEIVRRKTGKKVGATA